MVKSATDDETGTAPGVQSTRKPPPAKVIVMGSISTTDIDFLSWRGVHCPRLSVRDAMLMYVRYLNGEEKIRFEQELEQWKAYMRSTLSPEERKETDDLKARNDKLSAALYETRNEDIPLSPQNNSQNIPLPLEQSPLQVHPAPLPLEQSPPLNIMQPVSEQMTGLPRTPRPPSPETVNANKLTMQQALELFELLQARKSKEADKAVTVEAEPIARAPARAEPLSYLTLGTVEGIVGSANPDEL